MSTSLSQNSLSRDIGSYIRYQLRGRRGLIAAAVAVGIPSLWIGWPWLVVAGIAPILIALAPCAIMCALGYCAMRGTTSRNEASGSSLDGGEAGCCSRSQSVEDAAVSFTDDKLAEGGSEPLVTAVPPQARPHSVDGPDEAEPEAIGKSGASATEKKEKFQ
ncbi:hypothetical protein [Sinorhizobium meliloti]|uniref:hypothetical protein n=1 Tax=Rhizobium meliloti TaxID=382 RepID=UPI000B4976ED|nr:hypothetical protein [Sinorhizobium meliloti]MDX0986051.1 hypothetical protein [Sinorhizobium medicae]ASQ14957.1 hypothetical protein CDO22_34010 [Sinorhizobium meliloti]MDX1066799.1 hypothetical protein [Sinorhizobium medicae]MQU69499.1 hypothetical protein [Sinorhizobium meliloti]MQU81270.1 hypothetical protein [Sinorhizobium meliloti]